MPSAEPEQSVDAPRADDLAESSEESVSTLDPDEAGNRLGREIRAIRLRQGFTLAQLAEQVKLTSSALSQIERGASDPSLASLRRIASALRVPMFQLLAGGGDPEIVVRRNHRIRVSFPAREPEYQLMVPDAFGEFSVLGLELEAGCSTSTDGGDHHPSTECAIVSAGQVVAEVAGRAYELGTGDTVMIHRDLPHRFQNPGPDKAELIIIIAPAIF